MSALSETTCISDRIGCLNIRGAGAHIGVRDFGWNCFLKKDTGNSASVFCTEEGKQQNKMLALYVSA